MKAATSWLVVSSSLLTASTVKVAQPDGSAKERPSEGRILGIAVRRDFEKNGKPFGIQSLREIQLSRRDVLDMLAKGRALFSFEEWKHFLLRSVGLEPAAYGRAQGRVGQLNQFAVVECQGSEQRLVGQSIEPAGQGHHVESYGRRHPRD